MRNTSVSDIVYRSQKVEWQFDENGNRKVVASVPINNGDLLLVEHLMELPSESRTMWINYDSTLYNALHPRINKWDKCEVSSRWEESSEKWRCNAFSAGTTKSVIGLQCSAFNHSPHWNAHCSQRLVSIALYSETVPLSRFVVVESVKNIKPGEEVYICYTDDDDFADWIGKVDERIYWTKKISDLACKICDRYTYTHKEQFFELIKRSELSKLGIYMTQNKFVTERFDQLVDTQFDGDENKLLTLFTMQLRRIIDKYQIYFGDPPVDLCLDPRILSNYIMCEILKKM